MSRYISKINRQIVIDRAFGLCEYCLLHESQSFLGFEVDHIVSVKHGGNSLISNLAYACAFCNQNKGSDLGTILLPSTELIRFFNPRADKWTKHFAFSDAVITPNSKIGEATIKIFQMNQVDRIIERENLISANWFPHSVAQKNILL